MDADGYLEVIRQLGSAGVAGIHGDEDSAGRVQQELGAFEEEHLQLPDDGLLDAENLLRDHRQDFYLGGGWPGEVSAGRGQPPAPPCQRPLRLARKEADGLRARPPRAKRGA